jgi:hypothetical protein
MMEEVARNDAAEVWASPGGIRRECAAPVVDPQTLPGDPRVQSYCKRDVTQSSNCCRTNKGGAPLTT